MSPAGPLPTPGSLTTACPCGDPADFACKNAELIAATRTTTMGKDFPGRGAAPEHHVSSDQAAQPPELVCPARTKATPSPAPGALRRRTAPPAPASQPIPAHSRTPRWPRCARATAVRTRGPWPQLTPDATSSAQSTSVEQD
ncbi:uncharacterized protein LOC142363236 isoform X2 [Opisthocomus hoazin]|uniref:uncharacterized protein LOC142363236 isoform X2 n=1 Tax=Opisthocomus hoazin TaxID=30419 RepID=UPI003F52C71C